MADIPVEIWQLVRDEDGNDVVLLRDERERLLAIVIGICEAAAIWVRLAPDAAAPYLRRPWAHDLMQNLLDRLGAHLERVVIDDLAETTFFATLHLRYLGRQLQVDARPSDAIALALRLSAPLFVSEPVMDQAAHSAAEFGDEGEGGMDLWGELP